MFVHAVNLDHCSVLTSVVINHNSWWVQPPDKFIILAVHAQEQEEEQEEEDKKRKRGRLKSEAEKGGKGNKQEGEEKGSVGIRVGNGSLGS